jgi:hypothetical protein
VAKEKKRKFLLFPCHRHRSESHAAAAIQQPAVQQEQQVQGVSAVLPSFEGFPPFKATGSPSKGWFVASLKWFFGPRQLPAVQSSPTRQRSTKSKKTTITSVVVNNRNFPSNDSDVEDSPSKPKEFHVLFRCPAKQKIEMGNADGRQCPGDRVGEERGSDGGFRWRVELGVAGGAVKDAEVVVLGARLGSEGRGRRWEDGRLVMLGLHHGRYLRLVGGSSRKLALEGKEVRQFRRLLLLQVKIGVRYPDTTRFSIFYSLATPTTHKLETRLF